MTADQPQKKKWNVSNTTTSQCETFHSVNIRANPR